jgi:hypothetical protein
VAAPVTEAEAYLLLERMRWGGSPPSCPHCGTEGACYYLRPAAGSGRPTRTGALTERRVWKCGRCRRQFSVLTGTIFEGTRIPLRSWIGVVSDWPFVGDRSSGTPAARSLAERYGLSPEAAAGVVRRLVAAREQKSDGSQSPHELLASLLRLPAADAAAIRARTPGRVRPRPQVGPSAEYGDHQD